ncbi:PEP-CTERM sorting domain-containing protein [Microcoleus sp. herbarium2]|uniref:PEP-CTERM sorting domain-containing protein n=1 Tax=Microcoleus sp. herbarium2 TaxID=3055433 RepID=UPI002FD0AADC
MGFPTKLFTIKGDLVFMNNLYHKVVVASVGLALGFTLGANKEAKAATFSDTYYGIASHLTFHAIDGSSYGSFDGLGDTVTNVSYTNFWEWPALPHSWRAAERTDAREVAALLEFPLSSLTRSLTAFRGENAKITSITNAVLQVFVGDWQPFDDSAFMGAFGYVGNGIPEASDFEAGVFLDSKIMRQNQSWYEFNVTSLVKKLFSNNNEFGGFALRSLNQHKIDLPLMYNPSTIFPPKLIVSGEIEGGVKPEPVPEPTTIFGSAIGLCLGGWLKRKKSSPQDKTTSQH